MTLKLSRGARSHGLKMVLLGASMLGTTLGAGSALAEDGKAATAVDEIVVTGARVSEATVAIGTDRPTATVSITREALLSAPAGITGLKMLESLPGFNVQANDALGMYEFGNSVSVRAFNFQQIGFLLDDIPMGRSDQFGGSPIYRYVDNENLQRVTASAGAGDVALPSYASLGPIVDYVTSTPAKAPGAAASQTFGSDDLRRTFLRLETGEHAGFSGYASGSWIKGDLWRGPGTIDRKHYEAKLRYEFGSRADLTFQTVHNHYFDYDSPDITKAQYRNTPDPFYGTTPDPFGRSGRDFAYLGYVPVLAPTVPGVKYSNPLYNQYYKFAVNKRVDHLYGLTLHAQAREDLDLSATAYYEDKSGYGVSPEAYSTSLARYNAEKAIVPGLTAPKGLQYGRSGVDGTRKGVTAKADWKVATQDIAAGVWVEKDDYHRTQARYNVVDGNPDGAPLLNEPVHLQRNYVSTRDTLQFFLKDTLSLADDRLKLDVGFKTLRVDYNITGKRQIADYLAGRTPSIDAKWRDNFLPQVGVVYSIDRRDQVFASYSESMAMPRGADDVFSAASPAVPAPKAETAKNWELGARTNHPTINASAVVYLTRFQNRLQSYAAVVPGSMTTETFYQNVGGVRAYGAELSSQWQPQLFGGKVTFNANLSYNVAKFRDDFAGLAITGNRLPDFPEWLFQGGVTVVPVRWAILNLSARHVSSRFTNYTNTETTSGYTIYDAYLDLGDGFAVGPLKQVKARLNVDNIFDKDYLGTISAPMTSTPAFFRPGPARTVQVTLSTDL